VKTSESCRQSRATCKVPLSLEANSIIFLDCRGDAEEEHRPDGMTTVSRNPERITLFV
jgi:hypothetical protein